MNHVWQRRQSEFNHDWLKNQYMPALASYLNLLEGRIEDRELEETFLASVLPQWELYRDGALALAEEFEELMSPRHLFHYVPLSNCDEDTKLWLGNLVHHLWLVRCPVKQWVANAKAAVENVNVKYDSLLEALKSCSNTHSAMALRPYKNQFSELRERCQDLANAVSNFPREMILT